MELVRFEAEEHKYGVDKSQRFEQRRSRRTIQPQQVRHVRDGSQDHGVCSGQSRGVREHVCYHKRAIETRRRETSQQSMGVGGNQESRNKKAMIVLVMIRSDGVLNVSLRQPSVWRSQKVKLATQWWRVPCAIASTDAEPLVENDFIPSRLQNTHTQTEGTLKISTREPSKLVKARNLSAIWLDADRPKCGQLGAWSGVKLVHNLFSLFSDSPSFLLFEKRCREQREVSKPRHHRRRFFTSVVGGTGTTAANALLFVVFSSSSMSAANMCHQRTFRIKLLAFIKSILQRS
ncbi:hypothetical protein HPP92_024412 [Vanilla planifolia]|uniref:Uncharacterized protein n=1 Tax=Vanilla planifolia TaxID=51239 RepID=A0A835UBB1_VANPL|nr:hypothetical protein HPP92_024412 [Vanilla planifolia]